VIAVQVVKRVASVKGNPIMKLCLRHGGLPLGHRFATQGKRENVPKPVLALAL
jgi:hypothetical protein